MGLVLTDIGDRCAAVTEWDIRRCVPAYHRRRRVVVAVCACCHVGSSYFGEDGGPRLTQCVCAEVQCMHPDMTGRKLSAHYRGVRLSKAEGGYLFLPDRQKPNEPHYRCAVHADLPCILCTSPKAQRRESIYGLAN